MDPVDKLFLVLWGKVKTAKTSIALTAPKPLVHFDLDVGFERAEPLFADFKIAKVPRGQPMGPYLTQGADIVTKPYQPPVKWGPQVQGYIALWNELVMDFKAAYEDPLVQSLVPDTGSMMWKTRTTAQLEKVQTKNPDRIRLSEIEYTEPNADMRGLLGASRFYGKNLIIVHHVGGVYVERLTQQGVEKQRIGDTYEGWKHTEALTDLIVMTEKITSNGLHPPAISARILTCGLTLSAEGLPIPNPSFNNILSLVNTLRSADVTTASP